MQRHLAVALLLAVFTCAAQVSAATIGASGDFTKPSQTTNYNLGGGEFHITENVALDPTADPWQPGTAAQISQYPTPEPAGLSTCVLVGAATVVVRRRSRAEKI